MKELRTEIEINATPERVWDTLMDFQSYPEWNPFMQKAAGKTSVGERLEIYLKPPGGMGVTIKPTVMTFNPGREFRWKGKMGISGLFDGEHIFELRPTDSGCHLVHHEKFTGILVLPMLALVGKKTLQGFNDMNAALKLRAESTD
ncbi:MAG: SRPBCC domain-containing protein [Chloroflexi bacterium]|nr:SRPBCC domain-containing protein [Chloroflexota bacterium]